MGEVRILGPIEVVVDGRAVAIGSTQLRRLLAALAVHADSVVSIDRLVDILWGDTAPIHAPSTLAKCVYRLRSAIGDDRNDTRQLITQPPGYVLRVDGQLDADRFSKLVSEARRDLSGADPEEARERLAAALALWRGPALGEFAYDDFAQAEAARLEELRASALEDRGDIDLTLGRHVELLDELSRSIAAYPLRERFRGQLMLALYRSGRQPEALRAYNDFRTRLIDEVGLEPSSALQELDQAIAQGSRDLAWTPPTAPSAPAPPHEPRAVLPSGTVTFVFTDIEHSTNLLRQLDHRYAEVLDRHRGLIRTAVSAHRGAEVNTEGDGMFFAFADAADAISACVAAQRALLAEVWGDGVALRVRMGIHTGEAVAAHGDYAALAVHQAARVKERAHGGQILVSQMTADVADGALPEQISLRGLGAFNVRDFEPAVGLHQVVHPELPAAFPPPRQTSESVVHSPLPSALLADRSALVGRKAELEWLDTLWARVRSGENGVAFLIGPAGAGKSRLVAEFARRVHASGAVVVRPERATDVPDVVGALPGDASAVVVLDELRAEDVAGLVREVMTARPDVARLAVVALTAPFAGESDLQASLGDGAFVATRELGGLDKGDVAALLARSGEDPTPEFVAAVLGETGGRPALVVGVANQLRERHATLRVERALQRAGEVRAELQAVEDDIATGVLERSRPRTTTMRVERTTTCPYKGLARFDVADADYYFGRERLVAALAANVATASTIGIVGASGSGKSSLLRAGLIASLTRDCLPGSSEWPVHVVRPGADPLGRLEREFGTRDVDAAARRAVHGRPLGTRVLLAIDQFEELFTLCDEDARSQFIDLITDLDEQESPTAVVVTLRADYYGSCAAHPALARLLERHQVLVGAMSSSELRDAIVEPARRTGLEVEPALVDAIIRDVAEQPGILPLVSTALLETWAHRMGDSMTLAAYQSVGGVRGALARLGDRAMSALDPAERDTARRTFLRLAQLGEGNDDVSRRTTRRELGEDPTTTKVLAALIDSRLLTADGETVEVAHEALLREWPQLRSWLEADRDGRRAHRQVADAALQWDADERDPSALFRGARLAAATEWVAAHPADPNALEREFLGASIELDQQEIRRTRHTARRLRELAVGLSILLVVALLAGTLALVQRHNADHQAALARTTALQSQAGRLAALARTFGNDQIDLALLLGLESHRLLPSVDTEGALESALVHVPPGIDQVMELGSGVGVVTPTADGEHLVAAKNDGTVDVWDIPSARLLRTIHGPASPTVRAAASRDGRLIVAGYSNGDVAVYDSSSGSPVGEPFRSGSPPAYGSFANSDGSALVVISHAPGADLTRWQGQLWDRHDPKTPRAVGDPFVFSVPNDGAQPVAFADAVGSRFIAGNTFQPPTVSWDVNAHQPLASLPISNPSPWVLPDGTTIAGDDGDHVDLVDVNSGTVLGAPFPSIGSPAGAVVVSPDGRVLATAPTIRTGKVVVFDVASRAQIAAITLPAGAVPTEFLPDGRLVITVGGQVVVWRPGVTVPPLGVTLGAPDGPVYAVFSEDGRTVATFHSQYGDPTDHPVYAFDGLTGAPMGRIADGQDQHNEIDPNPVALSPDGKVVAIAARDGAVHLRDATTGDDIGVLDVRRPGGELGVVWSPTGNRIATIGVDQAATLWDVSDLHHPKRTGPPLAMPGTPAINPANLLAEFSRDGRSLLVTDAPHGTMTLFDVDTGAPKWSNAFAVFPFAGRLGYTAQNELFVTSGGSLDDLETGRTISLLDPATGRPNATFAPREAGGATDYARNGDLIVVAGTTVATGDNPSTVVIRLYDAASGALLGEPLPVGPVPADPIEKETYIQVSLAALVSPDGERVVTAPAGPGQSVVLWDVDLTDWEATACRIAGRNLTQAEWQQYLAGQPYHVTCPQWPAGT